MKDNRGFGRDPDHGHAGRKWKSATYVSWANMMQRCYDPKSDKFPYYGERGIRVCIEWHDFKGFLKDMGERPPGMTLGRIDNDGNYEPGNCRWEDHEAQMTNRRNTVWVQVGDRSLSMAQLAREVGVWPNAIRQHLKRRTGDEIMAFYANRRRKPV